MIETELKGDAMPVHHGLSGEVHKVGYNCLALLFNYHGRLRMCTFLQVGGKRAGNKNQSRKT